MKKVRIHYADKRLGGFGVERKKFKWLSSVAIKIYFVEEGDYRIFRKVLLNGFSLIFIYVLSFSCIPKYVTKSKHDLDFT